MSYNKSEVPASARTAITRHHPSALAKMVIELLEPADMVFDWGCGKGYDVIHYLTKVDTVCGWDPHFNPGPHPSNLAGTFNIVTCSCVLNVLEMEERVACLQAINSFLPATGRAYFSVRSKNSIEHANQTWERKGDGWVTSIGTFQHGFTTSELTELLNLYFGNVKTLKHSPLIIEVIK